MDCPKCGSEVLLGSEGCERCGAPLELLGSGPEASDRNADPSIYEKPLFSAPQARGPSTPAVLPWSVHEEEAAKTPNSFAGGLLILLGGLMSMVHGMIILTTGSPAARIFGLEALSQTPLCGTLILLFALMAVVGGVMGVMRKNWWVVLAGSVFCLLSIGWFYLSMMLGFIGLILVAMTRDEFD